MNNKSPLRYPGGKTRACKILEKIVLEYFNINNYSNIISPFFGGGSFEFYLQNKYNKKLIVNDKFVPLFNFWNQCKNDKNNLYIKLLEYHNNKISKDDFYNYRNIIMDTDNELYQAIYYFIINRCSFSGATLSGGFSKDSCKNRFTKSSIERINKLNLTDIDFYNNDFEEFIISNYKDNMLMFLDPPYYLEKKSNLYGNKGNMHNNFDHVKLYDTLKNKKKWIMTYNNCEFIKNLYNEFIIVDAKWSYGMNKTKKSSEIIIISQ
jgi:DNA adenine methylase